MENIYIIIALVSLAIIAGVLVWQGKTKPRKPLSRRVAFAFLLVLFGSFFVQDRLIGYSLIAIGIILAVFDAIKTFRQK